jgi:hypothetical protein
MNGRVDIEACLAAIENSIAIIEKIAFGHAAQ